MPDLAYTTRTLAQVPPFGEKYIRQCIQSKGGPGDPPPPAVLVLPNLALAGDWMEPVLPATLDAAVRAGRRAARALER